MAMSSGDALHLAVAPMHRLGRRRQQTPFRRVPYAILLGLLCGCLLCTLTSIERVHKVQDESEHNLHRHINVGIRTGRRLGEDIMTPLHQYQGPSSFETSVKSTTRPYSADTRQKEKSNTVHVGSNNDTITSGAEGDEVDMFEVVHIVYTRFMQFQPNLVELGKARLEIFRTFCLPSMIHQSTDNFLWIIHADPELHITIKQALIDLLSPFQHFLLVASNRYPSDFRSSDSAIQLLDVAKIWSGNVKLARLGRDAAKIWPVLETRLDADDGLHNYFVQLVQNEAAYSLARCGESAVSSPNAVLSLQSQWMVWCAYTTIEWHCNSPFSPSDPSSDESFGYLLGVATHHCQTAGLTIGYCPETPFSIIPNVPHHKFHKTVPRCSSKHQKNCLQRLKKLSPASIRARTMTSAGMSNVIVHNGDGGGKAMYNLLADQESKQESLWKGLAEFVHIKKEDAIRTKLFMVEHLRDIAADNLKGQCTKGHSCKNSTQSILKNIANRANNAR